MNKSEMLIKAGWNNLICGSYEEYEDCLGRARAALGQEGGRELEGERRLLEAVAGMGRLEQAEQDLKAAREMLGGPSRLCPWDARIPLLEVQPFFRYARVPGAADETAARLSRVMELLKETAGSGAGIAELFQVQLSYYRGEQAAAQELAVKVFKMSSNGGQNMLGASAAFYLCNIARDKGDVPLWNTYIDALKGMERRKDTAGSLAWVLRHKLLLWLAPSAYVPQSLKEGTFGNIPAGKGWISLKNGLHPELLMEAKAVHIQYLARSGQYEAALWKIEEAERMAREAGAANVARSAYYHIYRAYCYGFLGLEDRAFRAVESALDLLASDRLWQIAVQLPPDFHDMVTEAAAPYNGVREGIVWVGNRTFEKAGKMRTVVMGDENLVKFTDRELTVVNCLEKGAASRAEIAGMLSVSEHTVKRHLENIYRKAGTTNIIKIAEYARQYRLERRKFTFRKRHER